MVKAEVRECVDFISQLSCVEIITLENSMVSRIARKRVLALLANFWGTWYNLAKE